MKRLLLLVLVVSWPAIAVAQSTVNATYTDPTTGARVNVGNSVARSIRAAIVDATGNPFGTLANPIRIDPVGTTTQPVSGVGNFTAVQPTGSAFHMTCDSGCSASPGFTDNSAFTYGTTAINPIGGVLDDVSTNLATENSAAIARITSRKALHVNLRDNSGNELGVAAAPVQVSLANTAANGTAVVITGTKTNNNASPGATNIGALPAVANASAPTLTEGNLVAASVDLHGSTRTTLLTAAGAAASLSVDATAGSTALTTGPQLMGQNAAGNAVALIVDACEGNVQSSTPISITTATTTRIVAPTSAKKTYICGLSLFAAAADNVGIVEGTGGTCGTGTAGVIGGTTAANGVNAAANGGFVMPAGKVAHAVTAGTNVDLCLITSAATPLAGVIKWVQQ